ncbi:MAG TPA: NYN domain-containing protein [Mycobacteriales bacterium]|nr:NYN domain-containing protein [Mycobacteriales bacterium]
MSGDGPVNGTPASLPEPVRARVVALAAERLGQLPADEIPGALRQFARFTPAKRARLAAAPLATAVDADPVFRSSVAQAVRAAYPELVGALDAGAPPPAADPFDAAAAAYLCRTPGWPDVVRHAADVLESAAARTAAATDAAGTARLSEQLAAAKSAVKVERERARAEIAAVRSELDDARRRLRMATEAQRAAEAAAETASAERDKLRRAAERLGTSSEAELKRARARLAELESQLEQVRRAGRESRSLDELRLWLLVDTLTNAAQGLRRELALPPTEARPADAIVDRLQSARGSEPASGRGLAPDDAAWLESLVAVPGVHLVVDGYNVTKTGYGTLPLEAQRTRLVQGVASLAARTGAEVTVVFDGAERLTGAAPTTPRRVRVIFSPVGRLADDVILSLVRAEPPGRPVVVVSSDAEVADGARAAGARAVASPALLGLLGRG